MARAPRTGRRTDGGWPGNLAVGIVNGTFLLLLGTALVMAVVSVALRPQRHFRARLWPRPVAAQDVA